MKGFWRRIVSRIEYPEVDLINRILSPDLEKMQKVASEYGLSFDGYWRLTDAAKADLDVLWTRFHSEVVTAPDGPKKDAWRREFAELIQNPTNINTDYKRPA